jgi:CheY-like chemotaxis protein
MSMEFLVRTSSFDLVISDIGLPDGTGHDLMKQIKETHGIPGMALTAYGGKRTWAAAPTWASPSTS